MLRVKIRSYGFDPLWVTVKKDLVKEIGEEGGLYCGTISKVISGCADSAAIGAVVSTAMSGGTATPAAAVVGVSAKVVSITNGVASILICGPRPSSVTSTFGVAAPGWWGGAVSVIDAALTFSGY